MEELDLKFFIECTENYFMEITGETASIGIPYLKQQDPVVLEFSGIIGISGKRKGSVYLTANQNMLVELGALILGTDDLPKADLKDLVGEIANTIAGNARKAYGSSFLISVPVVVEGKPRDIRMPKHLPAFVVPIQWRNHKTFLVVCVE